ncbi:MAG: ribulose-phosphate 3-epimerase [Lachnospiraceae bacterium]|nr:ribulose-phosphate 3-epimerase [Lachnospiraceae bacterium]
MMNILAPSILAADIANLGEEIKTTVKAGAKYLHIDVMDGVFVPRMSFGQCVVESIRKCTDIVFDVHLMIIDPIKCIEDFAKCGADIITVHLEACEDVRATLKKIKECGLKAGLSIKPATPVEDVIPYLDLLDMILIMSVEPGLGGQKYMEAATDRIRQTRKIIKERGLNIDVEVDGGVCKDNLRMILDAGANVIVSGSSIFKGDIEKNTLEFVRILKEAE